MNSFKNARFHNEIRKWNTDQLIENLECNALSDCCQAIRNREIDGDTFLNLTEGQLAFWRKDLDIIQVKRLWSIIQLARENPQNFVVTTIKKETLENPMTVKHEKVKSPIAKSLESALRNKNFNNTNEIKEAKEMAPPRPPSETKPVIPLQLVGEKQTINSRPELPRPESPFYKVPNYPVPVPSPTFPLDEDDESESEAVYEAEPIINRSSLPAPVPIPIPKREVPPPPNVNRPLPTPPNDDIFPLPPHLIPPTRKISPQLPRPPNLTMSPFPISNLQQIISDIHANPGTHDDEQIDYDSAIEANLDEYKRQPWFRNITRIEALELLSGKSSGTFIVRPSNTTKYECSFSIICEERIFNIGVKKIDNKYLFAETSFNTVMEIVERFSNHPFILTGDNKKEFFVTFKQLR